MRFFYFLLISFTARAQGVEQKLMVPAGGTAEQSFSLSAQHLKAGMAAWIEANPDEATVWVTSPDGRRWGQTAGLVNPVVHVNVAGGPEARVLGRRGTMVAWTPSSPVGVYRVELDGKRLRADTEVTIRWMTREQLAQTFTEGEARVMREVESSLFALPERRYTLDGAGRLEFQIPAQAWNESDALVIGARSGRLPPVAVTMPDGVAITEASAKAAGCTWQWTNWRWLQDIPQSLEVHCPSRMRQGPMQVRVEGGPERARAAIAVAVVRGEGLRKAFEMAQRESEEQFSRKTVRLRTPDQLKGVVGQPVAIRVVPDSGSAQIASIEVSAQLRKGLGIEAVAVGPAQQLQRQPDGSFLYTVSPGAPGVYSVLFTAGGATSDGKRFAAHGFTDIGLQQGVGAASNIRQLRIDVDQDGRPDRVRFLIDLEVRRAGRFDAAVWLENARGILVASSQAQSLAVGRHTLIVESHASDRDVLPALAAKPSANLHVEVRHLPPAGQLPGVVPLAGTLPKAGDFEQQQPGHTGGAGSVWELVDTNNNGKPDHLGIRFRSPGACDWTAWLEVAPKAAGASLRTAGYQQSGRSVPGSGVRTLWNLAPFFPESAPGGSQQFRFQVLQLRCGRVDVQTPESEPDGEYHFSFRAGLENLERLPGGTARVSAAGAGPRVASTVVAQPVDRSGDGVPDHLRTSFDILSPGGVCVWRAGIETLAGAGVWPDGRAQTKPGRNRVSMETDLSSLTLDGEKGLRVRIEQIRCGANPDFTKAERIAMIPEVGQFAQEFTLGGVRFGKNAPPVPVKADIEVRAQFDPIWQYATDLRSVRVPITVKSGGKTLGRVATVTAQAYLVDFDKLRTPLKHGPAPLKIADGAPVTLTASAEGTYVLEFARKRPGQYVIDLTGKGTLANGAPFTATGLTLVPVYHEAVAVVDMEQRARDANGDGTPESAEILLTLEAQQETNATIHFELQRGDDLVPVEGGWRQRPTKIRKGRQTVALDFPKDALSREKLGGNVTFLVAVKPEQGETHWDPAVQARHGMNAVRTYPLRLQMSR